MNLQGAYRGGFEGRSGVWFSFTFDVPTIRELKDAVPFEDSAGQARHWDKDKGHWWVAEEYMEQIYHLFPALEATVNAARLPGFE